MNTCNIVTGQNIYSVICCHEMVQDSLVNAVSVTGDIRVMRQINGGETALWS